MSDCIHPQTERFDFKAQARRLGDVVGDFAEFAKQLNADMLNAPGTRVHINTLIGRGRFNRAVTEPDAGRTSWELQGQTVLYGDELRAQRRNSAQHEGLFAAFVAVHHPLLAFAQQMLADAGQQGFTCGFPIGGRDIRVPLQQLKLDFDDHGNVFTASDIHIGADTVPAHTPVMNEVSLIRDAAPPEKIKVAVYDGRGNAVRDSLDVAKLLWVPITAKGKNIFSGADRGKSIVLDTTGADDMVAANEYMIEAVTALQKHGYDPEPLWGRVCASAKGQLAPFAPVMALAADIARHMPKGSGYSPDTITDAAQFFGVALPALAAPDHDKAAEIVRGVAAGRR